VPCLPLVYFRTCAGTLIVPTITKAHKASRDGPFATLDYGDRSVQHVSDTGGL
jgi:hypothetical protein